VSELDEIRMAFEEGLRRLDELIERMKAERDRLRREFEERLSALSVKGFDMEGLEEFLEEPYVLLPKGRDEWYVIVPKWVGFHVGWLEHQTRSYNIFVINRYMQWITPIPLKIRERLKFPELPPLKVYDGYLFTGVEHQEEAWRRYRRYLVRREGRDRIKIKKGYEFQLISRLIEDGILPFIPRPVDESDLRDAEPPFKLRTYQKEWWSEFMEKGAIGVYSPYGSGKSVFGAYAIYKMRGRRLVVVPTLTLKEQWLERLRRIGALKGVDVETYRAFDKVKDKSYTLVVFDEVHHLPANTYIRFATLRAKYRIGLSGSPFREDHRESYIFALTGFPVGVDWSYFIEKGIVRKPVCKVYIVGSEGGKLKLLKDLLKIPVKTIIFSDSIRLGELISKRLGIPFVYGATRDRMEILRKAQVAVVSRVGDEGISLPDIERVIEVSFLYGSRMQEIQRFGRLMHALREEPEHIIIFTEEEYQKYHKRLYSIAERGFRIDVIRG